MSFKQKYGSYALITGGTSGIGEEMAKIVASKGVNIILVARRENVLSEKAEMLKKEYGVEVKTISADLTKKEDLDKVLQETDGLEVGLLIPNAAIENHGFMMDLDLEKELAAIQMDVTAVYTLTHHFGKKMAERGRGGILLISSMIGHMPNPYFSNYAAIKAYVANLGFSLNYELKKKGVDVTVLSPGPTDTPMLNGAMGEMDISKMPMTIQQPDYVAKLAIDGLGNKPHVIPGFKNTLMVRMAKMMSIATSINSGGKMMDKVKNW
ncbi:MAG: SDR family NAD(P)-dependent oxidoreductase [Reichenbachiella sp.]